MDVDAAANATGIWVCGKRGQDFFQEIWFRDCIVVNISHDRRSGGMRTGVTRFGKSAMSTTQIANLRPLFDDRASVAGRSVVNNYDFVLTGIQRLRPGGFQTTR